MDLTLGLAFLAGLVSFVSPCVLPLVPAYVGYMGGRVVNTVAASTDAAQSPSRGARFSMALHGLFFVAGFTFVFVAIGLLSTAFIQQVGGANINLVTDVIARLGGILIVFFGLHFMGAVPRFFTWVRAQDGLLDNVLVSGLAALLGYVLIAWGFTGEPALWASDLWTSAPLAPGLALAVIALLAGWLVTGGAFTRPGAFWERTITRLETALYSDTRRQMAATGQQGFGGSTVMGVVFAAGWTPCIGPVYGAVLTLAASGGDVGEAGVLLAAYSLGLGLPFLLTTLLLDRAQGVLRGLQRQMRRIELASGTFLIAIGLAVGSGQLQALSTRFAGDFAEFSVGLEEQVVELATGREEIAITANADQATATVAGDSGAPRDLSALEIGLDVGDLAPAFQTVTERGTPVVLTDLRGQVVVLNFWATWCGPCRIEMPAFQQQFEQRAADGFTILAVNNGESAAQVAAFRDELGLTFPLLLDERGAIQAQYGIFSYPSTLVLDRDGVIVARHFGLLTADQLDTLIADSVS